MARRERDTIGELKVEKLIANNISNVIGAEAANVINIALTMKGGLNRKVTDRGMCLPWYISSDAAGQVLQSNATGPDAIAIDTNGALLKSGGDQVVQGHLIFEATGVADLDVTHAGADTFYFNLVLPDGSIWTSGALTFDATT